MKAKEFFDKVIEMRKLQKAYFAKRDAAVLTQCKAVEREIDAEINKPKHKACKYYIPKI